jgi:chromosome partitioning protein
LTVPLIPKPQIAESQDILKGSYDLPLIPVTIGDRRSYFRAVTTGQAVTEFEPEGLAAAEIRQLWHWIKEQINHE